MTTNRSPSAAAFLFALASDRSIDEASALLVGLRAPAPAPKAQTCDVAIAAAQLGRALGERARRRARTCLARR
jgi:hypothetical protein